MALAAFLVSLMAAAGCGFAWAQQNTGGYEVEAAYLYSFAKAAKWPAESLPDRANLIIGVLGGGQEFVKVMEDVLAHKDINSHSVEVRHLRSPEEVKFCNVVFFRLPEPDTRAVLAQIRKSGILLIGENKDFLNDGGMINLALDDGKISYDVNTAALEHANLRYGETSAAVANIDEQTPAVQLESTRSITFRVVAEYPRLARSLNLTGSVHLQVIVRADGTVKQVKVIGGHPVLAKAAAAAVMRWHYEAGPRETTESVKISFGE